MNHWLETSKINLIPLSVSRDFREALSEWQFTGHVIDYDNREIECELCEHPDLSHHYEIKNKNNENKLLVGSKCILKFQEISICDEKGNFVTDQDERKIYLEKALKEKLREIMLEPLRKAWLKNKLNRDFIENNAKQLKKGKGVSPNTLVTLFKFMRELNVSYKPSLYKISLRSYEDQIELDLMEGENRALILESFSSSQRQKYKIFFGGK